MHLQHVDATELDLNDPAVLSQAAVAVNAQDQLTIVAPASGYIHILAILAIYTGGAGPFNLSIAQGAATFNLVPITGSGGEGQFVDGPFDASLGNVVVTLPAGGVGVTGVLLLLYKFK